MIPSEQKLLSLLSNHDVTFFIPPYQRNYEWTDDQCNVFLEDVKKTYELNKNGNKTEHFFGSITFFKTLTAFGQPDKLVLIDGQQRITTTMLFLMALRDIVGDTTIEKTIDSNYLRNNNIQDDTEYKIKLKQVETDWIVYKNLIINEEISVKEKASAVYRNYQFFINKLNLLKRKGIELGALIEKGLSKFSVITIELQPDQNSWENPQEIFESMNSLGKPLTLADLVRNYLLLGLDADTQDKLYNKYWLKIETTIPGYVSDLIRDYMQAKEGRSFPKATESNHKHLYSIFKTLIKKGNATGLLKELEEASKLYAAILPGGTKKNDKIDKILGDFNELQVTTAYSFLLVLLKKWKDKYFSDKDTVDILTAFLVYCQRRRLFGLHAGENKNYPQLVNKIPELKKAKNKMNAMFAILSEQEANLRLPNDLELERHLTTMNFYNFAYCKYFLALVEEKLTKHRPDIKNDTLTIEHIMPQTLNNEWKKELGSNYQDYYETLLHNIGNLTLTRFNQELSNDPFREKKKQYKDRAGLQIAQTEITNRTKWTDKEIKKREKWIINYLLNDVLPIPDKMRKANNYIAKQGTGLSFKALQLIGCDIVFSNDTSIVAHVISDKKVEFEGKSWDLSKLTKEIYNRKGMGKTSNKYQGYQHWEYDEVKLADK